MKRNRLSLIVLVIACASFSQSGSATQPEATEEPKPASTTPKQTVAPVNTPMLTAPAKGRPRIVFEKELYDFGNVEPGSNNVCEFKFKNEGNSLLTITEVTKTCGCTPYTLEKMEYQAGESGTLKVEFHAARQPSAVKKTLFVFSNDPGRPKIELTIAAEVVTKFDYKPKKLDLVFNKENAGCPAITIRSIEGKPFSIKQFSANSRSGASLITADFDASAKATEFVLQPKVDMVKLPGESGGNIEIVIAHPEDDVISIPFEVLSKFKINPPSIIIYKADLEKPVTREMWVLNNYGEDFEIESTSSQEGTIKVLSQEKIENRYKLMLEITPPVGEKNRRAFFTDTFFINIKDGEKLKVACRMFIRKAD
jgi:hypothetical protein